MPHNGYAQPKSLVRKQARGAVILHSEKTKAGHLAQRASLLAASLYKAASRTLESGDVETTHRLVDSAVKCVDSWMRLMCHPLPSRQLKGPGGRPVIDVTPDVDIEALEELRRGLRRGPSTPSRYPVAVQEAVSPQEPNGHPITPAQETL